LPSNIISRLAAIILFYSYVKCSSVNVVFLTRRRTHTYAHTQILPIVEVNVAVTGNVTGCTVIKKTTKKVELNRRERTVFVYRCSSVYKYSSAGLKVCTRRSAAPLVEVCYGAPLRCTISRSRHRPLNSAEWKAAALFVTSEREYPK